MSVPALRLDKLLWHLRFAPTRSMAQGWIAAGHIRLNGRRVDRSAASVRVGDILTLPLSARVLVIELTALPRRRGPAAEAQACYRDYRPPDATDSQDAAVP